MDDFSKEARVMFIVMASALEVAILVRLALPAGTS